MQQRFYVTSAVIFIEYILIEMLEHQNKRNAYPKVMHVIASEWVPITCNQGVETFFLRKIDEALSSILRVLVIIVRKSRKFTVIQSYLREYIQ